MIAPRAPREVSQGHSHVPAFGEMRTQSPWSCPTLWELLESKIGLWNVSRSPDESPFLPVLITVSVSACSRTATRIGRTTARVPANEIVSAAPTITTTRAPTNKLLRMVPPLPPGHRTGPEEATVASLAEARCGAG